MAHAQRLGQVCRYCRGLLPHSRRSLLRVATSARFFTSEAVNTSEPQPLPPPPPDGVSKSYPEKIQSLVRDISKLTLLETAQLNELLKSTLNIPDAPVMTMGAMPAGAATSSAQGEEKQEEEQTSFTVSLVKYAPDSKIKLIKEIKTLVEGMNLVQSKKFVESVPQVVQRDVSKEEAERLKSVLEAAGGVVELE